MQDIDAFLTPADAQRATRALRKLAEHDIGQWALAGGLALEIHIARAGGRGAARRPNDLDFIVDSFEAIPGTLGRDFLIRHVHPEDPVGKTLLQAVDAETKMRVDVFHAHRGQMERAVALQLEGAAVRMVSLPDVAARLARLNWDLNNGRTVAAKFARDFLRVMNVVRIERVEQVWREHRRSGMPATFAEASSQVRQLIAARPDLIVEPEFSTDVNETCARCRITDGFALANAQQVLDLLGYC